VKRRRPPVRPVTSIVRFLKDVTNLLMVSLALFLHGAINENLWYRRWLLSYESFPRLHPSFPVFNPRSYRSSVSLSCIRMDFTSVCILFISDALYFDEYCPNKSIESSRSSWNQISDRILSSPASEAFLSGGYSRDICFIAMLTRDIFFTSRLLASDPFVFLQRAVWGKRNKKIKSKIDCKSFA